MDTLKYPTPQALMEDTCNAIREKDGTSEKIDHQDVPDRIRAIPSGGSDVDLSGITAQSGDVSERVQFMDSSGKLDYGTMPEIADETVTLDGNNTEHDIVEGHHKGGGKVNIVPDTLSLAPSFNTQEITSPDGIVYTKVILDPIPDIYKDVSAADAVPGAVLDGYTFYGKAGELETGNIVIKTGKQGATVSANGTRYIPVGYHDGTTYIIVNVPQEIVTVQGEDSSGTTAVAADIREGKTARSKGKLVTGTMPDVELPTAEVSIDKGYSDTYAKITSVATVPVAGYITPGNINGYMFLGKYTGTTIVTPEEDEIILQTAGKLCENNITISGVSVNDKEYYLETGSVLITTYNKTSLNISLNKITSAKYVFVIQSSSPSDKHDGSTIYALYKDMINYESAVISENEYYELSISNDVTTVKSGNNLTVSSGNGEYFWGYYKWCVVGI